MRLRQSALAIGLLWGTNVVAQVFTSGQSAGPLPPAWKSCAVQMISVFENESTSLKYDYIENLHDGRGYTAGPYGFSVADGDLLQVVEVYDAMRPDNVLSSFIPTLKEVRETASTREISTRGLEALPEAWKKAASDPRFRQAQDQVSDKLYYAPAMRAADDLRSN